MIYDDSRKETFVKCLKSPISETAGRRALKTKFSPPPLPPAWAFEEKNRTVQIANGTVQMANGTVQMANGTVQNANGKQLLSRFSGGWGVRSNFPP